MAFKSYKEFGDSEDPNTGHLNYRTILLIITSHQYNAAHLGKGYFVCYLKGNLNNGHYVPNLDAKCTNHDLSNIILVYF